MIKVYKKDDTPPSEMFVDSMSEGGVGSDELTCGWCDRLHMCPDSRSGDFYGDEDRDSFKKYCETEYKKDPDGVVLHYGYDAILGRTLNDILFVLDCPCNGLSRFEKFIWNNKNTIRHYLKTRIEDEHRLAEEQLTINKLVGI